MFVLDKLWRGEISPSERLVRPGRDYQKLSTQRNAASKRLLEMLSPEAKEPLEVGETLTCEMTMLAEEDTFICGFQLGARLMLDIIGDHCGQFRTDLAGQ